MHFACLRYAGPILILCSLAQTAAAYEQVDQQVLAPVSPTANSFAVSSNQSWGQIFTISSTGYLSRIDLQMARNPGTVLPLNIEIRKSGTQPDLTPAGLVYSTSVPAASVPTGIAGTFTTTIQLLGAFPAAPGDKFAILCSTGGDWYNWFSDTTNSYAGGTALWKPISSSTFAVQSGTDSGFAAWISDIPTPEPSSLAGVALALTLFARRPRR